MVPGHSNMHCAAINLVDSAVAPVHASMHGAEYRYPSCVVRRWLLTRTILRASVLAVDSSMQAGRCIALRCTLQVLASNALACLSA